MFRNFWDKLGDIVINNYITLKWNIISIKRYMLSAAAFVFRCYVWGFGFVPPISGYSGNTFVPVMNCNCNELAIVHEESNFILFIRLLFVCLKAFFTFIQLSVKFRKGDRLWHALKNCWINFEILMLEDTDDYHSASKLVSNHSWIKQHGLKNYEVLYLRCTSFYCSFSNFAEVSQHKKHFKSLLYFITSDNVSEPRRYCFCKSLSY